jgi:tetratricopeptide (TPR) repeat protein
MSLSALRVGRRWKPGRLIPLVALCAAFAAIAWQAYRTSRPDYQFRQGQEALQRGDHAAAEQYAVRLEQGGHRDEALLLRGQARFHAEDYAGALDALKQISNDSPLRQKAIAFIGLCHLKRGELPQAELTFSYLLGQGIDLLDAHRGLAAVCYDLGDVSGTLHHAREWAKLDDHDGRPYRWMGLIYKEQAHHAVAVSFYQDALRRELSELVREEVRQELAECLLQITDYTEVLKVLEDSHPPEKLLPTTLYLRAEALHGLDRPAEARSSVKQALGLKPDIPGALRLLAQLHLEAREPQAAAALLERAVKLAPLDIATRHKLAEAYTLLERPGDAQLQREKMKDAQRLLEAFGKVSKELQARPRDPALHAQMAKLFEDQNMPDQAERWRRSAALFSAAGASAAPARPPE